MNRRKKVVLTALVLSIMTLAGLGALRTISDTITLKKIRVYVYSIDIYDDFRTGSYELLLSFKFMRHFGDFGGHLINNDDQYPKTNTYFESCETFDGGVEEIKYCYEYFDYSYCKPLGEANGIVLVTFRVKKNVFSHEDLVWGLGGLDDTYGVYYEKTLYFKKYNGGLIIKYMFLEV
ncbi:hypothetical protein DRO91_00915 [Candidatus Heimdallarchaeota archaeon]|nr:MAG: hypothetical protein DRO63_04660 [Candidatus Gerdarchaeota archaeon]RLI70951.1 MAG: hypothetical protein DRP02_06260 [Candidatus Gerdarchaeota archaeon]RLI74296.1 MAG: hypothetical protein DRO91_00915 [Candidatus Heimdallarchaeota archaeon]